MRGKEHYGEQHGLATGAAVRSIDVFTEMDAARADWLALSDATGVSPYQSFAFLSAWRDTIGRAGNVEPFIIVARDADGAPTALLPLCVIDRSIRIALFLGGRESNFNLPLLRPDAGHDSESLRDLLVQAARLTPAGPDLYYLRNQPLRFEGVDNPLAFRNAHPSASFGYGATLPAKADALAARFSKETRKKLRRKEQRLAELGALTYEHRVKGAHGAEIVDALLRQKAARFDLGGEFARLNVSGLLNQLRERAEDGGVELHALRMGERIVATYAGVVRGGRFSAMLNSFEQDDRFARCSPGELLLHALMRDLVARGMTHFDLGAGEARYKSRVCDETIALCDATLPVSARGAVVAPLLSAYLRLKRRVKQTPALAKAYYRLRSAIAG
ncbi:MAG: GNAT family N-acetyltransferase [Methylocystis sp.]|uniref:GNAT family N-acetyltransferase n=1 Tax=Methylocystis sp. TaxID=1911079 RepID=UPI003DA6C6C0